MRLLLLSDIHANLAALTAVLEDAARRGYERALFLGDALGYGPRPREVLAALRGLDPVCVQGNHDALALRLAAEDAGDPAPPSHAQIVKLALRWQLTRLAPEDLAWIEAWPETRDLDFGGAAMRLRHGSPESMQVYVNSTGAAREAFARWDGRLCFVGHTHVPAVYATLQAPTGEWIKHADLSDGGSYAVPPGARVILNPGSVGQPRDGDPRASYALFDTVRGHFEVVRVPYDVASTQAAVREVGLPEVLGARLGVGK